MWADLTKDQQQAAWRAVCQGTPLENARPARYRAQLLRELPVATTQADWLRLAGRLVRPIPDVAAALKEHREAILALLQ